MACGCKKKQVPPTTATTTNAPAETPAGTTTDQMVKITTVLREMVNKKQ